jgi:hypothetical protein
MQGRGRRILEAFDDAGNETGHEIGCFRAGMARVL